MLIYWQRLLRESMQRAQCIIVVSEHLERTEYICAELTMKWLEGKKPMYVMNSETQAQVALRVYYETMEQVSRETYGTSSTSRTQREIAQSHCLPPPINKNSQQKQEQAAHPDVSIIIPASRLAKAEQTLETLSRQQYAGKLEILMVGPPARQLGTRWPIRVVHSEAVYKPGKARNLGAAQARGDILLFLDDDMLVAADWVELNVQALKQKEAGAVGARMPGKTQTFYARCTDFTNYGYYQHKRALDEPLGAGSIAIYKTLFVELGGFDEDLYASEDIELCQRIRRRGYRTMYRPEIVVIHDHHYDTLRKFLKHNYICGYQAGLETRIRQYDKKLQKFLITTIVRHPLLFLPLLPFFALLGTTKIVCLNIHDHQRILFYAPYIFLGKLAYQHGVFICLLRGERIKNERTR
jgi:glycosyltransferase involved in cell wall biosynthesis